MTLKKEIVVLSCGDNATSHNWAEVHCISPLHTHARTHTHKYSTRRTVNVNPH